MGIISKIKEMSGSIGADATAYAAYTAACNDNQSLMWIFAGATAFNLSAAFSGIYDQAQDKYDIKQQNKNMKQYIESLGLGDQYSDYLKNPHQHASPSVTGMG